MLLKPNSMSKKTRKCSFQLCRSILKKSKAVALCHHLISNLYNQKLTAVIQNSTQIVFYHPSTHAPVSHRKLCFGHNRSAARRDESTLKDLRAEWSLFWSLLIQSNLKFTRLPRVWRIILSKAKSCNNSHTHIHAHTNNNGVGQAPV